VNACTLPGFCTGSPGRYLVSVFSGIPPTGAVESAQFALRLGIEVRGGRIHFRDLYDLMRWNPKTPDAQVVSFEDGFYAVTVLSSLPSSGIAGEAQQIYIYLEATTSKPTLNWDGVPLLCE
jgi:hypothetical protein